MTLSKGGCQCGAVRFEVSGPLGQASVCHCRMCQKAFGNVFAPLVSLPEGALTWTKANPSAFKVPILFSAAFARTAARH